MLETPDRGHAAVGEGSRKRMMTKDRKEQNRVASKAYRQREREKLLVMRSKPRGIPQLRPRPAPAAGLPAPISVEGNYLKPNDLLSQDATNVLFQTSLRPEPSMNSTTRDESQQEGNGVKPSDTLSLLVHESSSVPGSMIWPELDLDACNLMPDQLSSQGAGGCGITSLSTTIHDLDDLDTTSNDTRPSTTPDAPDMEISLDCSNYNGFPVPGIGLLPSVSPSPENSSQEQDGTHFPTSWNVEDSNMTSIPPTLLISPSHQINPALVPSRPSVADPYKNYIQMWRGSAFTAGLYIAILVGFDMNSIRSSDWCSPFYRQTTPADDPGALLLAAHIPCAPESLQPTLPQILFPHHTYLDLIPFPSFRARAITLASTVPPLFDWWELKKDINAGLVCWNPWNGANGGNVQPWDARSWKAAPWFLKKWRMLIN